MTWNEMVAVEPRLAGMLMEAKAVDGTDEHFCANRVWSDRFKPELVCLVGWTAKDPRLSSSSCYDLAYQKIYNVLPYCKTCLCL